VTKIYLGNLEVPAALIEAIRAAGFAVVAEDPPKVADRKDLAIVEAGNGVTSTVRHEVLNAMTTVLGFAELLQRRNDLPENVAPKLDRIREYGLRVRDLMRGFAGEGE
jgi:signal transduction histidine kinase